jgi:hypothetical protein
METINTQYKELEFALIHGDPEVRANAALNSTLTPTRQQVDRGLKDKSQLVRQAFLNRQDITFDCYQLLLAAKGVDLTQIKSVSTLAQLEKFKNRRFRSGKPMNIKKQTAYIFSDALKFEQTGITTTTEETV